MKITELLEKDTIILQLQSTTKLAVLDELINQLDKAGKLKDKEEYKKAILKREEESTTGVGDGIAIPHAMRQLLKSQLWPSGIPKRV